MPDVRDPVSLRAQIEDALEDARAFDADPEYREHEARELLVTAFRLLRDVLSLLEASPPEDD